MPAKRRSKATRQKDTRTPKKAQVGGIKLPDGWEDVFFDVLGHTANVRAACQRAKVSKTMVYGRRSDDAAFAARWLDAIDDAADVVEQEIFRRGVTGYTKPVTIAGQREMVREYSDTLLIFYAKAMRPEKFRDRHDHRVSASVRHGAGARPEPEHPDPTPSNVQAIVEILGQSGALDVPEDAK